MTEIVATTPYELDKNYPNLEGINRLERAQNILKNNKAIKKVGKDTWTVKSQSGLSVYTVQNVNGEMKCNCPDCIINHCECKHILAVKLYLAEREEKVEHSVTKRDWSNYTLGQTKEEDLFDIFLKELVDTVENPIQTGKGRKNTPINDKLFCMVKKVESMKSSRRAQGKMNEAEKDGFIDKSVHFNSVTNFLKDESLTPVLHELVRLSASPLCELEHNFSIDSSGFRTTQFNEWCDEKHGQEFTNKSGSKTIKARRQHKWVKCHISSGNLTNVIADVVITKNEGEDTSDVSQFITLTEGTTGFFEVKEICADAAYIDRKNFAKVDSIGAEPFIYFKKNCLGNSKGCQAWTKSFMKFMTAHKEYMEHYNKRNNVESTFGALKAKYGETLKGKEFTSQTNELLCKILAYNISVLISATFVHNISVNF